MNAPLPDAIRKALETVSLDDKYALASGRALMSGTQALVRLPMLQKTRDAMKGLNTRGFTRGYRGAVAGEEASRGAEHRVHTRRQRGARGDRRVGIAAARSLSAVEQVRRCVRH